MTDPTIPNGHDIPRFTTAAPVPQVPVTMDDLAAAWDKAEQFTMRRRSLPEQIRYIARQIMTTATQSNDAHLHALYVSLCLTATEAEKLAPGPVIGPELRDAVAAALIARIKQAVIPPSLPGQIGSVFAATEFDLADVALKAIRPYLPVPIEADTTALAAIKERRSAALNPPCGHGLGQDCEHRTPAETELRAELAQTYLDLMQAIAHDRQPYPTAWAYEQACKAREKYRERADSLLEVAKRLGDQHGEEFARAGQLAGILQQARVECNAIDIEVYTDASENAVGRRQAVARLRDILDPDEPAAMERTGSPQRAEELGPDGYLVIVLGRGPAQIIRDGELDDTDRHHLGEIVAANERRSRAEHGSAAAAGGTTTAEGTGSGS